MTHKDMQLALRATPVDELYSLIFTEQAAVLRDICATISPTENGGYYLGDDGYDYLNGALRLMTELLEFSVWESGTEGFPAWLAAKADPEDDEHYIMNYGSDGVSESLAFLCMTDEELTELDNDELAHIDDQMLGNAL